MHTYMYVGAPVHTSVCIKPLQHSRLGVALCIPWNDGAPLEDKSYLKHSGKWKGLIFFHCSNTS